MPAFHASGRSFGSSEPSMSRCSSSKRRMMWRLYVVSSASTRMRPGSARLTAARKASRSTSPSCAGNVSCSGSYQWSQNGRERPDEVLPGAALRLVEAERRGVGEQRALEGRRDSVRVVAVSRLVHRRPERVEAGLVVPRRHAHVAVRERRAERMHRRIEPVRALLEARACRGHACRTPPASPPRRTARGTTRRPAVPRCTSSASTGRIVPKTSATSDVSMCGSKSSRSGVYGESSHSKQSTYCRLSSRLRWSAGRNFAKSFVARASIQTWLPSAAAARQLDAELRRDAALLLPVAARHADEAGVVGVVVERLLERTEALEEAAELVVDEPLVHDLAQRRELVGTAGWPPSGIVTF